MPSNRVFSKNPWSLLVFFSFLFFTVEGQSKDFFVYAKSSLSIRSTPAAKSDLVGEIPYGKKIESVETTGSEETAQEVFHIDGLAGKWILVKFLNNKGYVFSGYISAIPAPTSKYYLAKYYKDHLLKRDGIKFIDQGKECDTKEKLLIENATVQEGFLIIKNFNWNFDDLSYGQLTSLDDSDKYKPIKTRKFQTGRFATIRKSTETVISSFSVSYTAKAGSGTVTVKKTNTGIEIVFEYKCG